MKMVVVVFLVLGAALPTWARNKPAKKQTKAQTAERSIDCQKLISDLREMRQAQSKVMTSFVKKNETIADALDYMANDQRNLNALTLKRSAKTFRDHRAREEQLVVRFETASDQLLDQVEQCLVASTRLSANK